MLTRYDRLALALCSFAGLFAVAHLLAALQLILACLPKMPAP